LDNIRFTNIISAVDKESLTFIPRGLEKLLPKIGFPTPRTQRTSILGVGAPIHTLTLGVGMPILAVFLNKRNIYISMISHPNTPKIVGYFQRPPKKSMTTFKGDILYKN